MRLAACSIICALVTLASIPETLGQDRVRGEKAKNDKERKSAERLFQEGRSLMKRGKYVEACAKLEASYLIDEATGTLINLARCYERLGKLARAWSHYRTVVDQAKKRGQDKRVAFARQRVKALEAKLPRLLIRVPTSSRLTGLTITRDDVLIRARDYGVVTYVAPGEHRIVAEAPGYTRFERTIEAVNGKEVTVEIPTLKSESGEEPNVDERLIAPAPTDRGRSGNGRRIVGLVTLGTGALGMAAGLGFGWSARTDWNQAFDTGECQRDTLICTDAGQVLTDRSRARADTATILLSAGAAVAIAGVVLYLTAPKRESTRSRVSVTPALRPDSVGITVSSGF